MSDQQWFQYKPLFREGQRVRDYSGSSGKILKVMPRAYGEADYAWLTDDGYTLLSQERELEDDEVRTTPRRDNPKIRRSDG